MIYEMTVTSVEETEAIAARLAEAIERSGLTSTFIAMRGEMGVGKTAFTRGFASHFGINGVKSPTYTVVNEYRGRCRISHMDLYRISDEDDLISVGYDDIIESESYVIAEWSENVEDLLPEKRITVTISRTEDENSRIITVDVPIAEVVKKIEDIGI